MSGYLCCLLSYLNRNSFSHYHANLAKTERKKVICQSGTPAMLSSEVNGPIAHGRT